MQRTLYRGILTGCGCHSILQQAVWQKKQFTRSLVCFCKQSILKQQSIGTMEFVSKLYKNELFRENRRSFTSLLYSSNRSIFNSSVYGCINKNPTERDLSRQKHDTKYFTVPNILTMFRLLVSPYIGYLVLCEQFTWAFGLVFLAGLTDAVDGWIARNFKGQSSNIGSYIDPLADKVLISILTLSLTAVHIVPVWLCGLIIARDLLLVGTSSHFHYKHLEAPKTLKKFFDFENSKVKMEPTDISKFNTFLQLGLVGLSVAAPVFHFTDHSLLHAYWYLVGSTTVLSGLSYVVKDKSAYIIK